MSARAKQWAADNMPDSVHAHDVLMVLAETHQDGGFCLPTADVCRMASMDLLSTAAALWFLRNKGLIRADGIGGLMSVELACDFAPGGDGDDDGEGTA